MPRALPLQRKPLGSVLKESEDFVQRNVTLTEEPQPSVQVGIFELRIAKPLADGFQCRRGQLTGSGRVENVPDDFDAMAGAYLFQQRHDPPDVPAPGMRVMRFQIYSDIRCGAGGRREPPRDACIRIRASPAWKHTDPRRSQVTSEKDLSLKLAEYVVVALPRIAYTYVRSYTDDLQPCLVDPPADPAALFAGQASMHCLSCRGTEFEPLNPVGGRNVQNLLERRFRAAKRRKGNLRLHEVLTNPAVSAELSSRFTINSSPQNVP